MRELMCVLISYFVSRVGGERWERERWRKIEKEGRGEKGEEGGERKREIFLTSLYLVHCIVL